MPTLFLIGLRNFHIILFQHTPKKFQILVGFPLVGVSPPSYDFFENPTIKTDSLPLGATSALKNEVLPTPTPPHPPSEKQTPPHDRNVKHPSMKWFLEKSQ